MIPKAGLSLRCKASSYCWVKEANQLFGVELIARHKDLNTGRDIEAGCKGRSRQGREKTGLAILLCIRGRLSTVEGIPWAELKKYNELSEVAWGLFNAGRMSE
ncbi:hypothetical protein FRX31_028847 [Thalictrum thalictroides]|uniref:Uncharacterized protein n=1 Tax=Thalictrum thalictroides TaxID=46969 RepID=A0A7J6V927_THATH|nr:hypothetical protein FRX31_028847 [Thalictrum thalictroides]